MLASETMTSDVNMAAKEGVGSDYLVEAITSSIAPQIWAVVEPYIERARNACPDYIADRELADDILHKIVERKYQLWLIYKGTKIAAVSVTSIVSMAQFPVCVVQYHSGDDLDEWLDTFKDQIKGWAREEGCQQIQLVGRDGWGRKLKSRGLKKAFTLYVADL